MSRYWLIGFLFLALPVSSAFADRPETHDGFYLRLTTGLGYSSVSMTGDLDGLKATGLAGVTTIGIGYAIKENFIINADIFGAVPTGSEVKQDGEKMEGVEGTGTFAGLGAGITYYFMPINIYLTGGVGMSFSSDVKMSGGGGEMTLETKIGWGVNLAFGKEWWVSENWGIGVAGQFNYMKMGLKSGSISGYGSGDLEGDLSSMAFGVLFSATYN